MIGGLRCRWRSTANGSKIRRSCEHQIIAHLLVGTAMTSDYDPDTGSLAEEIAQAIEAAEEMGLMSISRGELVPASMISDRLTPALMQARTYAEVDMLTAPEIRMGISEATVTASDLADLGAEFVPLMSMMYRLRERVERSIPMP